MFCGVNKKIAQVRLSVNTQMAKVDYLSVTFLGVDKEMIEVGLIMWNHHLLLNEGYYYFSKYAYSFFYKIGEIS